jgi:cytidyltransferase-like protein
MVQKSFQFQQLKFMAKKKSPNTELPFMEAKSKKRMEFSSPKVVIGGTFDILHGGHEALLRRAFSLGETTIGLTSNKMAEKIKRRRVGNFRSRKKELEKFIKKGLPGEEDKSSSSPFAAAQVINLTFSEVSKKIYLEVSVDEESKLSSSPFATAREGKEIKYFTLEGFDGVKPLLTESEEDKSSSSSFATAREGESSSPPIEDIVIYQQVDNDIYYLDNFGHLFKNGARITAMPFPIKQETEYALEIFQGFIFLRELNGDLYKFNPDLKVFENFFERINSLKISPDNKKLAYFSNHEIWILFLSDKNDPPQKKAGEKLFLIRLSETITDVFWINSNYLIFMAGDIIKISEIDDRDKLNIIDIFETKKLPQNGSSLEMFWNQFDKKLYLLSGNNLYGSGALLP